MTSLFNRAREGGRGKVPCPTLPDLAFRASHRLAFALGVPILSSDEVGHLIGKSTIPTPHSHDHGPFRIAYGTRRIYYPFIS
jgi:hypothetical protein